MRSPSVFTRNLAVRLLAATSSAGEPRRYDPLVVSDRLRRAVTAFAGSDGFASLQRRAWVLASADLPLLRQLTVGEGGRLEGWAALFPHSSDHAGAVDLEHLESDAAIAITAHLLELLVTFIGRPLTLRLLIEAWPDASLSEWQSITEAES